MTAPMVVDGPMTGEMFLAYCHCSVLKNARTISGMPDMLQNDREPL